jgi:hypothetical protein
MNLSDFQEHISHTIYSRGKEYYDMDLIDNVRHEYPDNWSAEIEGTYLYHVEIELNGDEIVSWNCDCPYDYGEVCKHTAAFLMYIKDHKKEHPLCIEIPQTPQQNQLADILKQTDKKEITTFLLQYANEHPNFFAALESQFHPKNKTASSKDYVKEIQKCLNNERYAYDRYDYTHESMDIANKISNYIEEAKYMIRQNCPREAIVILLQIIKQIGDNYEEYDDYDGDLGRTCYDASKMLQEMIESDLSEDLLNLLKIEIGNLFKCNNYQNYDLANADELLIAISIKSSDVEFGINVINEVLKTESDSFRTYSLVASKIKLLEYAGKQKDIELLVEQYLYLPAIRKIKLKKLVENKQYEKAIALINDGISIAEKKGNLGTVADWKDEKLSVFRLMNNREKVIELSEDLFFTGRESLKYYHILKTLIPKEQWAVYLDNFLNQSNKEKRCRLSTHILAQIYIEEQYWDRLMALVEKNIRLEKYTLLEEYERYLKNRFPERMLLFYRSQLINYAEKNMGRDHYQYIAKVLNGMKTYSGGIETVKLLITHFKTVYAKRRAMMEELEKVSY